MTFDDLYMKNDAWDDEMLIIIVDSITSYEMKVFDADIKFENYRISCFYKNVVLLEGGDIRVYEKCIKLS